MSNNSPVIGDLFRANHDDIQETITAIFYLLKQKMTESDLKQEARAKVLFQSYSTKFSLQLWLGKQTWGREPTTPRLEQQT